MASVLLLGGARSGKSIAAQKLIQKVGRLHGLSTTTVVTAQALDAEMAERIMKHREERPASMNVVEEPIHLADAIASVGPSAAIVIDCVTIWLSNRLIQGDSTEMIEKSARAVAIGLSARPGPTVIVSNEVGLGVVPEHPLGRSFRDLQGRVNRMLADELDRSYFVVAGRLLPLTNDGWADAEALFA